MYDYVLQYGFESNIQNKIQNIKEYLKENGIEDKERNWLPHITIDLYNCANQEKFIKRIDKIVKDMNMLKIEFRNLNDFDKKTLYIEPYSKSELLNLKSIFDNKLDEYRLEHRRKRDYKPHITLCTNDNINEKIYQLAKERFIPFSAQIKYIWIYNQKMKLIKEYDLENKI